MRTTFGQSSQPTFASVHTIVTTGFKRAYIMAGPRSLRRQQTRLAFTPLPSSSPAAKGYNKQIQERAATVSVDSPAKRRKLDNANGSIPTPAASREKNVGLESGGSDSEPVRATQRCSTQQTSKRHGTQKRLDFSEVRHSDSFSSPVRLASSPSKPQPSGRAGMFGSQRRQRPVVDVSSEDSDEELPTLPLATSPHTRWGSSRGAKHGVTNRKTRSTQEPIIVNASDDDIAATRRRSPIIEVTDDAGEDDQMPTTMGTQRRKRQRRGSYNSFISSSPPRMASSDDDDIEIIEKPRKRRQPASDEENESEEPVTPRKRKLTRREKNELAEDVDNLQVSSDEDRPRGARSTQSVKKNARQTALQRLQDERRRKSGQVPDVQEIVESDEDHSENGGYDAEPNVDGEIGNASENESGIEGEDNQEPPMSSARFFRKDQDDDGFVEEEDDDEPLGIPEGMPLEYTRLASLPAKELFIYAVEWMVQKKINPGFQMTDEIYAHAFRKLNDQTQGLVGSKFKSSVWRSEFVLALEARPDYADSHIDSSSGICLQNKCDACNRSNHPATFEIQFQGKPYHPDTLEEVAAHDDSDDSSSDGDSDADKDVPAIDAQGREILPESHTFYVGKFCRANAVTAHALQHWRVHLNEYVVDWLEKKGYNSATQIVERDSLSTKKRNKLANKIADRMEKEGQIKQLWREFKKHVDEARNAKQGGRFVADQ